MPITARLSRRFYETFGDEIVNELVEWLNQVDLAFHSELRDAHELGLQRLEAKVDQRFAELRSEIHDDMTALRSELREEMAGLRSELHEEMAGLRSGLHEEMAALRTESRNELIAVRGEAKDDNRSLQMAIRDLRAELIKWMFLFWVGTVGLTVAASFLK